MLIISLDICIGHRYVRPLIIEVSCAQNYRSTIPPALEMIQPHFPWHIRTDSRCLCSGKQRQQMFRLRFLSVYFRCKLKANVNPSVQVLSFLWALSWLWNNCLVGCERDAFNEWQCRAEGQNNIYLCCVPDWERQTTFSFTPLWRLAWTSGSDRPLFLMDHI